MQPKKIGVIPYTIINDKRYYLLFYRANYEEKIGKTYRKGIEIESSYRKAIDANLWNFPIGNIRSKDLKIQAALILHEKSMGLLGSIEEIKSQLGNYFIHDNILYYWLEIDYDLELPDLFSRVYQHLQKCTREVTNERRLNVIRSCPPEEYYLDTQAIGWYRVSDIEKNLNMTEEVIELISNRIL